MTPTPIQNPEQIARDLIDKQLECSVLLVQINGNEDWGFYVQVKDLSFIIE